MRAPIVNLEMDFRWSGVFRCNIRDLGIESFDLSWDRELGWVRCSVSSGTQVSGEGDEGGEKAYV